MVSIFGVGTDGWWLGPGGVPVACVAIGKAGAKNAAYLAAQILALSDKELLRRLAEERQANAAEIAAKDKVVREKFRS